jgi:hypothetical protein
MTPQTPAQRKAAERARNKAAGLVRLDLWVHPRDADEVKRVAYVLQANRNKAAKPKHGAAT